MREKMRFLYNRTMLLCLVLCVLLLIFILMCGLTAGSGAFFRPAALAGALALCVLVFLGYRLVYLPYRETERMLDLFVDGYTLQDVYNLSHPFSPSSDAAFKKLKSMLDTHELLTAGKRQAQYLALQNQINPHFLYNTLEGIRGEAIASGLDNIANMTEALATFFRYTISNVDQLVTLEDELGNIQNYYTIQQYRFGERISLTVECDENDRELLYKCRLPKITLQPIVENAIIHGIERKMGRGSIRIKLESTEHRLIITVSDDGLGMDEGQLRELNGKLGVTFLNQVNPDTYSSGGTAHGGIAVINVSNRIRLLFGEEYGVIIYSTKGVGTDVEITIPMITGRSSGPPKPGGSA